MAVEWNYFNQFERFDDKYLPIKGQGETMATQIVTAVTKLVYKWYNDGDVFDNNYFMQGWCNDLSSYANWLAKYVPEVAPILDNITICRNDSDYEDLLKKLVDATHTDEYLEKMNQKKAVGDIYNCKGFYSFEEHYEDDEDEDDYWEWEDEYDE